MNTRSYPQPGLLVSVRSAAERLAALEGGADLIDVKEPLRGPLGAADSSVVQDVVAAVAGRVPVSVALGEWRDWTDASLPVRVDFVKYGLAGVSNVDAGVAAQEIRTRSGPAPVLVAYADHRRAASPDPHHLVKLAIEHQFAVLLIDTFAKDGTTLIDWLEPSDLERIRKQLARADVAFAIAGSLTAALIGSLQRIQPNWFAVRGAACTNGRIGTVCSGRVQQLHAIIKRSEGSPI